MRNTRKLVALILALMLLSGAPAAFASTYVSDPVSPSISGLPSGDAQPEGEATPAPEATPVSEVTPAPEVSAEPTPAPEGTDAVVATENENGSVNIRAAASIDSEIIGTLTSGMSVTVLGVEGDWTHVNAGGIVGYVFSKYLKASAPEATVAPEAAALPERSIRILAKREGDGEIAFGDKIVLTAELTGYEGLEYKIQWQSAKSSSGDWSDIAGANGTTYTIELSESNYTDFYRATVIISGFEG